MAGSDVVVGEDGLARCAWCCGHDDYVDYHDREWGRPAIGDEEWFEKVSLEGFQAGLSWLTVLRKRERLRHWFHGFDPSLVAAIGSERIEEMLLDPGIIRHRGKVEAVIANAPLALDLIAEFGSLDAYFTGFREPERPRPRAMASVPATSETSQRLSRDLRRRGWSFVGPTTMYALMQSMGLVDDHLEGCHRAGG